MEYFKDTLVYHKKSLKLKATPDFSNDIERPEFNEITIVHDAEYMIGFVDEIHRQIRSIEKIGLIPVFLAMNMKSYEQLLLYNFNLTTDIQPKVLCGLTPIVSSNYELFEVEVLCKAHDEFMYREELSKVRYIVEGTNGNT